MLVRKSSMVCGLLVGLMVGAVIGATNCELIHDTIKKSKKEFKRFKRNINYMY